MKRPILIVSALLVISPVAVCAQTAHVAWLDLSRNSDPADWNCNLPTEGFFGINVIARPNPWYWYQRNGFYGLEFYVDLSELLTMGNGFIAGEISYGSVTIGSISPGPGLRVGFPSCQDTPIVVYTINVYLQQPLVGTAYVRITESTFITNYLGAENCSPLRCVCPVIVGQAIASSEDITCTVQTKDTTWGKIKEMYQ